MNRHRPRDAIARNVIPTRRRRLLTRGAEQLVAPLPESDEPTPPLAPVRSGISNAMKTFQAAVAARVRLYLEPGLMVCP